MQRIEGDNPSGVGLGGARLLAEEVMMGLEWFRIWERIWRRISVGRSRMGKGIGEGWAD